MTLAVAPGTPADRSNSTSPVFAFTTLPSNFPSLPSLASDAIEQVRSRAGAAREAGTGRGGSTVGFVDFGPDDGNAAALVD
jgi:hypothetical protein